MGALAGFVKGASQGLAQGVKLATDIEDAKTKKRKREGEERADSLVLGLPMVGSEVDGRMTPETYIKDNLAKNIDKPNPVERMVRAVIPGLKPKDAAIGAGIGLPPAPGAATPAGADTLAGGEAAPAGGLPATDVGEVVASPPKPRVWSDTDNLRVMVHAALQKGDTAAATQGIEQLTKLTQRDQGTHIMMAKERGPDGLANEIYKQTGQDVEFRPLPDKPGKFRMLVDGQDVDEDITLDEAAEDFMHIAMKNPEASAIASARRTTEARLDRAEQRTDEYQQASLALQRRGQELQARSQALQERIGNANIARTSVETQQAQLELQATQQELSDLTQFNAMMTDEGGVGDAFLNRHNLVGLAARMRDKGTTKVVVDPDTNEQRIVTTNPADAKAATMIRQVTRRFQASPFTQVGRPGTPGQKGAIIQEKTLKDPRTGEMRPFYVVEGVADGAFTNFDAAEMAARRMYPQVEKSVK